MAPRSGFAAVCGFAGCWGCGGQASRATAKILKTELARKSIVPMLQEIGRAEVANDVPVAGALRCYSQGNWLRAVGTAFRIDRNLTQAFGAFFGCGIGWGRRFLHARDQKIHWSHHEEIYRRRNQHEGNAGIDEVAQGEHAAVNGELNGGKIGLADNRRNQRSEQVFRESRDHRGERGANHDANRHVDYVAAKNELLESAEHVVLPLKSGDHFTAVKPPPSSASVLVRNTSTLGQRVGKRRQIDAILRFAWALRCSDTCIPRLRRGAFGRRIESL